MANSLDGVNIAGGANLNTIGGATTSARNVISGNTWDGIHIDGTTSDNNVIRNNYIGLGADGTTVVGNGGDGILISTGADNTVIGGVNMGNVILGNRYMGIEIDGASTGTVIQGNYIGINLAGTLIQGNGLSGILLENGADNSIIGGTNNGEANVITDNGFMSATSNAGIHILGGSDGNSIIGNSIYGNRGLGIDLGTTGVTPNDTGDGDTGPNNTQNFPVVTAASVNAAGTTVTVSGSISSTANVTGMLLHFYATPSAGNVNAREGRRYLGATTVNTGAGGSVTFSNIALSGFTGTVAAGELITATATTPGANASTSEFSLGVVATSSAGNSAPSSSQLVSTTDGGITMNLAGYNSYLETEDGSAILGGRTQLTMEFQLRAGPVAGDFGYGLASYVTPTVGDALYIGVAKSGGSENVILQINGSGVLIATDVDSIFDGDQRTLTATWNQSSGAYAVYRDGVLIGSGTGLASGQTIGSGGRLAFGVDLDSGSNTWQRGALFQGTFNDIRIFSDVRTAAEVAASYRTDLPYNEGNLIANWRLDDLSTERRTTNAVSGNDLLQRQLTQPGFSASTPELNLRIDENTVTGTVIGTVAGIDVEREARITALLAADATLLYNAETGSFYRLVNSSVSWTSALSAATSTTLSGVSGNLVRINSATENSFIWGLAAAQGADVWIGASDETVEGSWRWYLGTNPSDAFWSGNSNGARLNDLYVNWSSAEPSAGQADEDYARLRSTDGLWLDTLSSSTQRYVIEWNADDVLDSTNALTYSITSQTVAGAFAINSDSGVITVANGALLNFETNSTQSMTVRVSDGTASVDRVFTVQLNDLAESNTAPNNLSSGIELNTDGGNNAYLMTSNGGAVLGGLQEVTLEFTFAVNTVQTENTLFSYAVAGQSNEMFVLINNAGRINFNIEATDRWSTGTYAELLDGNTHSLAISWDQSSGAVAIYVDGQLRETATGFRVNSTIDGGGTLVLGQEQDSVNGGFVASQAFSGALYDVRVWNQVRSIAEIELHYQNKFSTGSLPGGLVANWQMDGFNGSNQVVDVVSGNNLSIGQATGAGYTASTPRNDLQVAENSSAGTRVGFVLPSDPDISNDIALDGRFLEAANPGTITTYTSGQTFGNWTVQSGSVELVGTTFPSSPLGGRSVDLNGSAAGAISQVLSTTAGRQYQVIFNTSGNWLDGEATKDFRVSAGGTSQDFSLTQPSGWSSTNVLFSGRSMAFTANGSSTTLAFQSLDSGNSGALIADVRVIEIPAAVQAILSNDSTLSYDAATGKFYRAVGTYANFATARTAATSAMINGVSGQLVTIGSQYENSLVQSFAQSLGENVIIGASDSTTEGTWRWQTGTANGSTFWIGGAAGTQQANQWSNWTAGEPSDSGGAEDFGMLIRSTGSWNDVGSSTNSYYVIEWDASEVLSNYTYTITSNPSGAFAINSNTGEITVSSAGPLNEIASDPTITIQVTDAAGNTYSEVMTIAVARVNDNTPVITSNGGGATANINVAENVTVVTTITATDADLPAPTLTYSIVGGADSALFSISSTTGALSFISGRNFESPADVGGNNVYDVTIRVDDGTFWDDQSIAVTIINTNEAPVLDNSGNMSFTSITEDQTTNGGQIVASIITSAGGDRITDVDSGANEGIAIRSLSSGNGTWQYSLDGTNWTNVGTVSSASSLLLRSTDSIRFVPNGQNATTASFDFVAWDQTTGTAGSKVSTASAGGTTAFSTAVESVSINVTAANDAPTFIPIGSSSQSATISITADNNYNLYVNGTLVGGDVDWNSIETYSTTLQAGDVVAIQATDSGGSAAMIAAIDFANGARVVTGQDWRISTSLESGWNTTGFNDSQWLRASTFGDRTSAPWGGGLISDPDYANLTTANWIWASDNNAINEVFFRYVVSDSPTVVENAANGTAVGRVIGNDVDTGETLTYSILSQTSAGAFSISSSTGLVTVADGSLLNYESVATHTVTVQMQDLAGATTNRTMTISLLDVNEAPVIAGLDGDTRSYTEGSAAVLIGSATGITDVDSTNFNTGTVTVSFTAGSDSAEDVLGIRNEGSGVGQIGISGSNVTYGGVTIGTFTGGSSGTNLVITLNASADATSTTALINNLNYLNTDNDNPTTTTRNLRVVLTDGDGGTSVNNATTMTVTRVNDAPVLDNTGTMTLTTITEDQTTNAGQTVASIISSASGDRITDVDTSAIEGIAITATTNGNGSWQYSTDSGSSWTSVGTVSGSSALLLRSTDLLRFVPNGQNATIGDITFRAWDQTTGTAGTKVDASTNGGTTAFSVATETAAITVTAVNDNIGALSDANAAVNTVAENAAIGTTVGATALATDVDSGDTVTYSLDYNANGRYAINSSTGVLTVAGALNAESQFAETLLVRATSSDGSAVVSGFNISVTGVNEAPNDIRIPVSVATENFESGATGWSNNQTVAGGATLTNYLGGWGNEIGTTQIFKDFSLSGSQTSVTITFDMYELDTWDGEAFKVWVDGVEYSSHTLSMDAYGNFYLGREDEIAITQQMTDGFSSLNGGVFDDEIHRYSFTINTTAINVRLGFSSALDDVASGESWGVDNLSIVENRPSLAIAENSANGATVGTVQGYDVDAGTTLTYSLTDSAGGRFAINSSTGSITVANGSLLNFEAATSHSVTVQVSDGSLIYSEAVTINLTNVNETPTAVVDTATAVEAGGVSNGTAGTNPTGNVLTNDTEVDAGDTKTVSGVVAGTSASASGSVGAAVTGTYGSINIAADGTYTYTVDNSNSSVQALRTTSNTLTDVYTYTMRDTAGLTSTTQITVTIQGANDAPNDLALASPSGTNLVTNGSFETNNGAANNFTAGVGVTVSGWTPIGGEGLEVWNNFNSGGPTSASDGISRLELDVVGAVNGISQNIVTTANQTYVVSFDFSNRNPAASSGIELYWRNTLVGTITQSTVGWQTYSFVVTGSGGSDELRFMETSATNDNIGSLLDNVRMVAESSPAIAIAENSANGTVVARAGSADPDTVSADSVTYSLTNSASGRFAINSLTGVITVADSTQLNFESITSHVITVRATDTLGLTYDESFTINVSNVNEAVTAVTDTSIAVEAGGTSNGTAGTNPTGNVLTNDTDIDAGDTKAVSGVVAGISASASGSVGAAVTGTYGSINIAADGAYTYTVDNGNSAVQALRTTSNTLTDVYTYTMRDAAGLTSTTQITVTIQGANDTPTAYAPTTSTLFTESFENPDITGVSDTDPPNWTGGSHVVYVQLVDEGAGGFSTPYGNQALSIYSFNAGHLEFWTTAANLNSTLQAGTTYDLSFNVAHLSNVTNNSYGDYTVELLAIASDNSVTVLGSVSGLAYMSDFSESNRVVFATAQNHSTNLGDRLAVRLSDNAIGHFANVPLFDNVQLTASQNQFRVNENSSNGTVVGAISYSDIDAGDTATFSLIGDPLGRFAVDSSGILTVANGSLLDFETSSSHTVTVRITDLAGAFVDQVISITVSNLNEAPVLDDTGNMILTSISEDATSNGGQDVASILASTGSNRITDGDTVALQGIAISATTNGTGTWQYSLDNGTNWNNVGTVSSTQALLLRSTDLVRFVPNGQNGTTGNITFVAWDQSGGIAGTKESLSGAGSSSAFSTATEVASITVTSVNDAPTIINAANVNLPSTNENTPSSVITVNTLLNDVALSFADVDTGSIRGVAVTGATGGGSWQYSTDGSTYVNITGVSSSNALLLNTNTFIRFNPDSQNASSPTLSFRAWDQTTGAASTNLNPVFADPGSGGGTTAFSSSTANLLVTVTAVNDAPITVADSATALEASGTANGTAGTNPTGNVLTNDTDVDVSDTKTVTGVAAGTIGSASGSVATSVTGTYGSINIAANGAYTYTVDNSNATVEALRTSGQTITDVFTYTMTDAGGLTSTTQITVTIQGANDAPTAVLDTATAVESGGVSNGTAGTNPTGNVLTNDTDPDSAGNGETKTVVGVLAGNQATASGNVASSVMGSFGSITIAANGAYTYTVDNTNATVQALRTSGQTIIDVFTYTMSDAGGLTSTTQITVTIQGANDTPVAVFDTAPAIEAGGISNGTAGTNPTGNVLTNDTDVDSSGNGETKTVVGVLAGTQSSASGNVANSVTGSYGTITVAANGAYTYTVDNTNATVQALAHSGQTIQDVFTYTVTDTGGATSTAQITVTIQGANDTPTIASNGGGSTASVTLAENITAVTTVVGSDVDAGTTFTYSIIGGADAGKFSINSSTGSLVFVTAPDFEIPTDVGGNNVYDVTIQVSDGSLATTQAIAVTITDVSNFLVVTTTTDNNDSGIATGASYNIEWLNANRGADSSVSLREAIVAANNTAGTDTVNFSLAGGGVKTINLASALPSITDAIVINGYSQSGSSANTLTTGNNAVLNIILNGSGAGAASGITLAAGSSGSTITGVVIDNFSQYGVNVQSANNTIAGNFIGIDQTGTSSAANGYGVYINNVANNTIGGTTVASRNVISGNTNDGVNITGASATNNLIQGNYIGTNAAGTAAVGNGAMGIRITGNAAGNTIGGATAGAGNLISGNANSGLYIDASNTTVKGNLIGTNAAGTAAIRNGSLGSATGGIFIASGTGSVIGGTTAVERNVLSGNGGAGLWIEGTTGSHTIQGNYIGVDITGDTALMNTRWGIVLNSGAMTNIQIGGTAAGAGNVISGNEASTGGIFIGGNADGTIVEGNRIGIGATVTTALGTVQAAGIRVQSSATNTRIGGTVAGSGNIIARNGSVGVTIIGNTSGTTVQGNLIYGNNGLAIDLGGDGTTANDGSLTAGQPNQLMDAPVLANANLVGNDLTVSGYVGSAASQATFANSRVEFYKTTTSSSVFLGALTTDASGNFIGTLDVTGLGLSLSDPIIATATDPNGNTSEFSVSFEANAAPTANSDSATAVEAGGVLNASAGTNPSGNVLSNDTDPNTTDTKTVSGVAAGTVGTAVGSVGSSVTGSYGAIQIAANGSYTYTVDNNNAAVQALRTSGNTLTDVFTYTMRDTGGLTSTTQVTITIQGANDAPVGVADNGAAIEAGGVANGTACANATGNVLSNDTDVDSGDSRTVNGVAAGVQVSTSGSVNASVTGTYGAITIADNGSYTYTADNSNAAVQALRTSGQSLADVFSYTFVDTAGLTSTTQVTITITGANDAPTAVSDTTVAVEAGGTANGTAGTNPIGNVLSNDTDPDAAVNGETKTVSGVAAGTVASASGSVAAPVTGTYGAITISAGGAYSYTVDNSNSAVQALRTSSDTLTDVFTYTMVDASGLTSTTQITVTIQGANDAPVAFNDAGTAVEAGGTANGTAGSNATGNVLTNDTDVDSVDTRAVHGVAAGVQASATGSVASSVTGSYGSVSIAADGSYTYTVDESNATVQALRTSGQSITDVFTYSVIDVGGLTHAAQLTITIQGANDAPTPVADNMAAVEAGGLNNATTGSNPVGNLLTNDTDVDSGDSRTVSGVAAGVQGSASGSVASNVAGTYGSIVVAADGSYTYTVDNNNAAVQALRTTGQTLTDVFTYTITDAAGLTGTTQVTLTIQGNNDTPTATSDTVFADEAGGLNNATAGNNPTGNVLTNDTDVDSNVNGETKTVSGVAAGFQSSATGSVGSGVTGSYGSIIIGSDGSFSYTVDNANAAVQALRTTGQTLNDVFTYTMTDAGGLTSSTQVTVTIRGASDTPGSVSDTASATEAGGLGNASVGNNPTGNVLTNDTDLDSGDTQTVSGVAAGVQASAVGFVGSSVTGTYGSITIAADGSYTYSVDNNNSAVEALRTFADTLTDTFTYTMVDAAGLSSTTQLVVTIHGQNDTLVAVNDSFIAVEAGGLSNATTGTTPTGNLLTNDTDVDTGDTQTVVGVVAGAAGSATGSVGSAVNGTYGIISVAADGSYSYSVDNNNSAVQSLRNTAQTLTEVFTYTLRDTAGATSTATATVTIQGANDTPVAVANTANAFEAGGINNNISGSDPTGNVLTNDTDVDTGDTKTVIGVAAGSQVSASGSVASSVAGQYGSIVINANGSYTYSLDNNNATVEALNAGSPTLTDTFTYTMTDTSGLTSTTTVVITIHGADDLPFAVVDMDTAVEAGGLNNVSAGSNPSGNVTSNDVAPNGQTIIGVVSGLAGSASGSVGVSVTGLYGSVVINSDGTYTYTIDNNNSTVEALLLSSDHLTDIFTYSIEDGLGYTSTTQLTITLDGANDTPEASNDTNIAVEAGGIANATAGSTATGNILTNDVDVDSGDTKSVVGVQFGAAASASGSVGASVFGVYGSIVVAVDGSYIYTVDNNSAAVQALRTSSNTLIEVFTYTMEDTAGSTSTATVTITIQGANDNPVGISDSNAAYEAGGVANGTAGVNPTGNVLTNDTDVDAGDSKSVEGVAAGTVGTVGSASGNVGSSVLGAFGSVTINADGSYTYTVDNTSAAVQALRTSSDTLTDVFTYTVQDTAGATSTTQLTITIHGANDAPITTIDTAHATEAGGLANAVPGVNPTGSVLANDNDVDVGDSLLVSGVAAGVQASATGSVGSSVAGSYGSIVIANDGTYTFTVDNSNAAVQALLSYSDTLTDTFTYSIQDASGATTTSQINIVIHGANDTPVAINESTVATEAGGLLNASSGVNPSGNVLTNDTDLDSTSYGETKAISGVASGVQASASGSVGSSVSGSYGSISIASDGSYTYAVDNSNAAVQALRTTGQTLTDVFTYTMTDSVGATSSTQITITIQGANDTPTAIADTGIAIEAGGLANGTAGSNANGNVLTNDTDVDSNANGETKAVAGVAAGVHASASGTVGSTITGTYGSIIIAADGSYTYTVDNNNATVQALRTNGQSITDVFTYTMIDTAGASSTTQITLTLSGANDAPTATNDSASSTEAGGLANGTTGTNPSGNVLTNDTDPDAVINGETKAIVGVAVGSQSSAVGSVAVPVTGSFGSIQIAANGTYIYTVDNSNAAVQALRTNGQTLTDVFTYTMTDAAGATSTAQITVTVHGANDAPSAANDTAIAIEAAGTSNSVSGLNPTGNVLANDSDVDSIINGETQTVTGAAAGVVATSIGSVGSAVTGNYGSISISADGSYIYTVDNTNAAVQALRISGQSLNDIFTYTMTDAAGLTATAQITVSIDGRNDAPVAQDDTADATEAGGLSNAMAGSNAIGNVLTNDQDVDSLANSETRTVLGAAAGAGVAPGSNAGLVVAGNYGSITIQSNGSYVYVIDENNTAVQALRLTSQTLTDSFTYKMADAAGLESVAEVVINLHGANDNPTAFADNGTASEAGGSANGTLGIDATGNVLSNDSDVDSVVNGETKTVIGVSAGVQSSVNANVGSSVVGNYGSITINADGTYTYLVDNNDANVQALRLSTDTLDDVFTYSMTDALGLISTTQVTITIQGANDSPYDLAASGLNINENLANGSSVGSIASSDLDDGDTPTYSLVDDAGGRFAIDPSTGVVTIADSSQLDFESSVSHNITVRVTDATGAIYDETFTITLNDVNELGVSVPVDSNSATNIVAENAALGSVVGITASASDLDATTNSVSYSLFNDDGGRFAINSSTGVVTVAGAIDRESDGPVRTITVRATSIDGSTADQSFSINIADVDEFNVGPIADIDSSSDAVNENSVNGTLVGLRLQAADADSTNSTIAYSLDVSASGRFQINPNTGVVTTAGTLDYEAINFHNITVRASSADGSFVTADFAIAVNNVNERPMANSERYSTSSSTPLVVNGSGLLANDTDPESDSLNAILISGPTSGSIVLLADGSFVYTASVTFVGDVTFQYATSDGSLNSLVQTVTISVSAPAAPASGGGSGSSGSSGLGSSSTSSDTGTTDSSDSTDNSAPEQQAPIVGAIDSTNASSSAREIGSSSNENSADGSDANANRSSALELKSDSQGFGLGIVDGQSSLLSNTTLLSGSHSALARLNAEQDVRLVQSLANTVDVIARLQAELQDNSQSDVVEGAKLIAKTAIGSGVVVWVLHISQVAAAVLAASSAWMHIDPLSILNSSKDAAEGKLTDAAEALFENDSVKK